MKATQNIGKASRVQAKLLFHEMTTAIRARDETHDLCTKCNDRCPVGGGPTDYWAISYRAAEGYYSYSLPCSFFFFSDSVSYYSPLCSSLSGSLASSSLSGKLQ